MDKNDILRLRFDLHITALSSSMEEYEADYFSSIALGWAISQGLEVKSAHEFQEYYNDNEFSPKSESELLNIAVELCKKELMDNSKEIDPLNSEVWESLVQGWALGNGFSYDNAYQIATRVLY